MKFPPIKRLLFLLPLLYSFVDVHAQDLRWNLVKSGGIEWVVKKRDPHTDQIEMSGKQISAILTYGVNEKGSLILKRKLVFPMLRTIPNDTRGSLIRDFDQPIPAISIDGEVLNEQPAAFAFNGSIKVKSDKAGLTLVRELFPSVNKPAFIEQGTFKNKALKTMDIIIPEYEHTDSTEQSKGVYGTICVKYKGIWRRKV